MRTIGAFKELLSKGAWACGLAAALGAAGCAAPVESGDEGNAVGATVGEAIGLQRADLVVGSGSCNVNIEPLRSIEIVHPLVVGDARAASATDGPWSFRRLIENMAPSSGAA